MLRIHNDDHVERVKWNPDFSIESRSNRLSLSCMFWMHHWFIYISSFVCKIAIFASISFLHVRVIDKQEAAAAWYLKKHESILIDKNQFENYLQL